MSKALGGDNRDRTDDPLLAKQVLSQLSYTPISFLLGLFLFVGPLPKNKPQKLNNDFNLGLMVSHTILTLDLRQLVSVTLHNTLLFFEKVPSALKRHNLPTS